MENTAFLCEISLRRPAILRNFYKKDDDFKFLMAFWTDFVVETQFFDLKISKMMDICRQEMNLAPRRPDFSNSNEEEIFQENLSKNVKNEGKVKKNRKRKGPRLSGRTEF
uniref:Uncharacterized protein n=1 Tax=Romanomermis culicivorax TaxID=13658 RepID=A0A915IHG0_ROMCU